MTSDSPANAQAEDPNATAGESGDKLSIPKESVTPRVDLRAFQPKSPKTVRQGSWLDILLFVFLTIFAFNLFSPHAGGDLYSDEADYALASTKGFEANRWDRS